MKKINKQQKNIIILDYHVFLKFPKITRKTMHNKAFFIDILLMVGYAL